MTSNTLDLKKRVAGGVEAVSPPRKGKALVPVAQPQPPNALTLTTGGTSKECPPAQP